MLVPVVISSPFQPLCSSPTEMVAGPAPIPIQKKAKFLRRLADFFHSIGPFPTNEQVVPVASSIQGIEVVKREVPRHGRLEKILGHFRQPSHIIEVPMMVQQNSTMVQISHHEDAHDVKFHLKILEFFHTRTHSSSSSSDHYEHHHRSTGSRLSPHSDKDSDISESEFEVVKELVPSVHCTSDLSFKKKYHFLGHRVIGKGASGVVRLGCSNSHGEGNVSDGGEAEALAVKEFRKRRKSERPCEYLRKLASEFSIASSLHHENVVRTLDIVHDGHKWYEVMEYCCNGDLFSFIQKGGLDDMAEIDCCLKQLVTGVLYLHSQGVAHRDLKPENLLIDRNGCLKITDFGISEVVNKYQCPNTTDGCVMSNGVCGSSPYIAPEEYIGIPYDARKVDVWAIGIIYYAMIFHGVPWESATGKDSNYCHYLACRQSVGQPKQQKFEPFTRLPSGARSLLRRILEPDPSLRISMQEIITDPWFSQIEMVPIAKNSSLHTK